MIVRSDCILSLSGDVVPKPANRQQTVLAAVVQCVKVIEIMAQANDFPRLSRSRKARRKRPHHVGHYPRVIGPRGVTQMLLEQHLCNNNC